MTDPELSHPPSSIARWLMVAAGELSDPAEGADWPGFADTEPPTPDNTVTVYDTTAVQHGRVMVTGESDQHYGLQVRVRAADAKTAWRKASSLVAYMTKSVRLIRVRVTQPDATYLVWAFSKVSSPIRVGKETPNSKRSIYTVNALIAIRQEA